MNEELMQKGCHHLENTGKYVVMKCLPGCKFAAWYMYNGPEKDEVDI